MLCGFLGNSIGAVVDGLGDALTAYLNQGGHMVTSSAAVFLLGGNWTTQSKYPYSTPPFSIDNVNFPFGDYSFNTTSWDADHPVLDGVSSEFGASASAYRITDPIMDEILDDDVVQIAHFDEPAPYNAIFHNAEILVLNWYPVQTNSTVEHDTVYSNAILYACGSLYAGDACPDDPYKMVPGQCGCGTNDTDTDGDGTVDCLDNCPDDNQKTEPGVCGCGKLETDTDSDTIPDCIDNCMVQWNMDQADADGDGFGDWCDGCPNDNQMITPGQCGCGNAEVHSDSDGMADCNDVCPYDSTKVVPGQCGCGTPDTDTDGDGMADCNDVCPNDSTKVVSGLCGCGIADTDTDSDGTADCLDNCPNDSAKTEPGVCDCGNPDTDTDGDGTADCLDNCPNDNAKTEPGVCGCGSLESGTDTDGDGTADCIDNCPGVSNANQADTDGDDTGDACDNCPNDSAKTEAGQCGCGNPDTDTDGDGTADCLDNCPNDNAKTEPGLCGCGSLESGADTDGDGIADCVDNCPDVSNVNQADTDGDDTGDACDNCPNDSAKTEAGQCGCGTPDTDTDSDGTADCIDNCPNDNAKTEPGLCGCGTPDTDTDGDGTVDCLDSCPSDHTKTEPGLCGCGTPESETDTDSDGTADCLDNCPNDSTKTEPGLCGCGTPESETDTDSDGTADCVDNCPNDNAKTETGQCGCGIPDTDTDSDGTADCLDNCPNDNAKTEPGVCGCGYADSSDTDGDGICGVVVDNCPDVSNVNQADADSDGTGDACDGCPDNNAKIEPGQCGCGYPDIDTDGDIYADCNDHCPNDSTKIMPGQCGCGNPDTDTDGDSTADCLDNCPNDNAKTEPGVCGCGNPDTDTDGDSTADCLDNCPDMSNVNQADTDSDGTGDACDNCPNDSAKTEAGQCGCGNPDTDTDSDGTADCLDNCPNDSAKTEAGQCGCGNPDTDTDSDGTADCLDNCPNDSAKTEPGVCDCGNPDTDTDGDGTADCLDNCPNDNAKTEPGVCGCGSLESGTDTDSDGTADCVDNCPDVSNVNQADTDGDDTGDACDNCPNDSAKTEAGQCGCGTPDTDTDSDGTADCLDNCPNDSAKTEPGLCGCGTPDTDTDGDGTADCVDNCPDASNVNQADTDGDGTGDACDNCPNDNQKVEPGTCGCGYADSTDTDGDGICGAVTDNCPEVSNANQADSDSDGFGDACDNCPETANADQADDNSDGIGNACAAFCPLDDTSCNYQPDPPVVTFSDVVIGNDNLAYYRIQMNASAHWSEYVKVLFPESDNEHCDLPSGQVTWSVTHASDDSCMKMYSVDILMSDFIGKCGFSQTVRNGNSMFFRQTARILTNRTCEDGRINQLSRRKFNVELSETRAITRETQYEIEIVAPTNVTVKSGDLEVFGTAYTLELIGDLTITPDIDTNMPTITGCFVTETQHPYELQDPVFELTGDFNYATFELTGTFCTADNTNRPACKQTWSYSFQPNQTCPDKAQLEGEVVQITWNVNCSDGFDGECALSFAVQPEATFSLSSPVYCFSSDYIELTPALEVYQYDELTSNVADFGSAGVGTPANNGFSAERVFTIDSQLYAEFTVTAAGTGVTLTATTLKRVSTTSSSRGELVLYNTDDSTQASTFVVHDTGFGTDESSDFADYRTRFEYTWLNETTVLLDSTEDLAQTIALSATAISIFTNVQSLRKAGIDERHPVLSKLNSDHHSKEQEDKHMILFSGGDKPRDSRSTVLARLAPASTTPSATSSASFGFVASPTVIGAGVALVAVVALIAFAVVRRNNRVSAAFKTSSLPASPTGVQLADIAADAVPVTNTMMTLSDSSDGIASLQTIATFYGIQQQQQ
jgi:Thrombospondin type 3 repeat